MVKIQDIRNKTAGGNSKRAISKVENIARHHSATTDGDYFAFWKSWKAKGWNTGGYHEIILRDGTVQLCYDPNVITNGIKNHNTRTYHICVVGNGAFTEAQEKAFDERCKIAMALFDLPVGKVLGHKEFSGASTACPGIDMKIVRARLASEAIHVEAQKTVVKSEVVKKPSNTNNSSSILRKNDKGAAVTKLQKKLIDAGFTLPKYGADGHYGDETVAAVKAFQRAVGITVDGIVGPITLSKLNSYKNTSSSKEAVVPYPGKLITRGSKGIDVERIQRAVGVTVDGIFGAKTETAVKEYQKRHGLKVDGVVGENTWNVMF